MTSGSLLWVKAFSGGFTKVYSKLKKEISFPILLRFLIGNVNLIFPFTSMNRISWLNFTVKAKSRKLFLINNNKTKVPATRERSKLSKSFPCQNSRWWHKKFHFEMRLFFLFYNQEILWKTFCAALLLCPKSLHEQECFNINYILVCL